MAAGRCSARPRIGGFDCSVNRALEIVYTRRLVHHQARRPAQCARSIRVSRRASGGIVNGAIARRYLVRQRQRPFIQYEHLAKSKAHDRSVFSLALLCCCDGACAFFVDASAHRQVVITTRCVGLARAHDKVLIVRVHITTSVFGRGGCGGWILSTCIGTTSTESYAIKCVCANLRVGRVRNRSIQSAFRSIGGFQQRLQTLAAAPASLIQSLLRAKGRATNP